MDIYEFAVVTCAGCHYFSLEELTATYVVDGTHSSRITHEALRGQPILRGFDGPMWGGRSGNRIVIRYEAYEYNDPEAAPPPRLAR